MNLSQLQDLWLMNIQAHQCTTGAPPLRTAVLWLKQETVFLPHSTGSPAFTPFCLSPPEFQLCTGHSRHQSHFPNEQIVFSSSLSLIFEPICAAISFSLFC